MQEYAEPVRPGKRRRVKRSSRDEAGTAETNAFEAGKTARAKDIHASANPYRASDLRAAWSRGWRFFDALLQGLLPLYTARELPGRRP